MKDDNLGVGVVDQVRQFIVEVAEVDVDRDDTVLERTGLGDQVLRRVVEIEPDGTAVADSGFGEGSGES